MELITSIYIFSITLIGISAAIKLIKNESNANKNHLKEEDYKNDGNKTAFIVFYSNITQLILKINKLDKSTINYCNISKLPKCYIKENTIYYFVPVPNDSQIPEYIDYLRRFIKPSHIMMADESPKFNSYYICTVKNISQQLNLEEPTILINF
jgi:hypothetical protein